MTTAEDVYGCYLGSAAIAVALLADPAVAAAWDQPSALAEFTVRGLAGHLARQVIVVRELLAAEPPAGEGVSLLDHYARAQWVGASLDHEANVMARRSGEAAAAGGAAELVRGTAAAQAAAVPATARIAAAAETAAPRAMAAVARTAGSRVTRPVTSTAGQPRPCRPWQPART
jgi:hypothetical protein